MIDLVQPVSVVDPDEEAKGIEAGTALCLSGGGYRAMVFHLGALIRLNETGLLENLQRISSVSGGSITAAKLGLQWAKLNFQNRVATNLVELVVDPIRDLAGRTIDGDSILGGILTPGVSISEKIVKAYRTHLLGDATLQDLPAEGRGPRFIINATNVQTGALWRFSRPYMGDYKVGRIKDPTVAIAVAVAASSAFPPVLSPLVLQLKHDDFTKDSSTVLQTPPFTTEVVLSDGGVYDNLGLETAWKRYKSILVSDGGGKMQPQAEPKRDWARHALRINDIIDNQVRSLRKRQLIQGYEQKSDHNGAYWGVRSQLKDYPVQIGLTCPDSATVELASTPTRLKRLEPDYQERLINWGYAISSAAIASHYPGPISAPLRFPYSRGV